MTNILSKEEIEEIKGLASRQNFAHEREVTAEDFRIFETDVPALIESHEELRWRLVAEEIFSRQYREASESNLRLWNEARAEIARFRKALEFYADENNTVRPRVYGETLCANVDLCKTAKEALGAK